MKTKKLLLASILLVLIITACGGSSDDSGDPVGVVKEVVKAMEKLDTDKASEYFCEDRKSEMQNLMGEGLGDLAELGMDADELADMFKITFKDMKYEEKSKGDDKAVVHIAGSMKMEITEDKFKEFAKKAAEAAGETVSDEELDFAVGMLSAMLSQEIPADGDVELIKEDGDWVVCSELDFLNTDDLFSP